jgi:hypothetical protein
VAAGAALGGAAAVTHIEVMEMYLYITVSFSDGETAPRTPLRV